MERLTKKFDVCENYNYYSTQDNEYTSLLVDKLGQLEDIMEKYNFESVEELDDFLTHNVIYGKWRSKL